MKRVRNAAILCMLVLAFVMLAGCELEITRLELVKSPNKTVYYAGEDTKPDFTGCVVKLVTMDGSGSILDLSNESELAELTVEHNIDFTTPGVYTVTLTRWKGKCSFTVEVVAKA